MILIALMQAASGGVGHAVETFTAALQFAPTPDPAPSGDLNTGKVVSFMASKIAPILLAILGVIFIGRASRGEISRVLTSSAIAIVGLSFIAGATLLFLVGDSIIRLLFQ